MSAVDGPEFVTAFTETAARPGFALQVMTWLLEVGKVHRGAGLTADALDLVDAVQPSPLSIGVAQLAHAPGEPWAATGLPEGDGSRLDIVSLTAAASPLGAGAVSGLIFDAWTEPIPGSSVTTGLAVHFDRPGARPPQTVLLAMPPDEGKRSTEHVETTLLQTLELAQMRAVGPETLPWLGHTLPAVFLPAGVAVSTVEED